MYKNSSVFYPSSHLPSSFTTSSFLPLSPNTEEEDSYVKGTTNSHYYTIFSPFVHHHQPKTGFKIIRLFFPRN